MIMKKRYMKDNPIIIMVCYKYRGHSRFTDS